MFTVPVELRAHFELRLQQDSLPHHMRDAFQTEGFWGVRGALGVKMDTTVKAVSIGMHPSTQASSGQG